jgi:pilus assembly protein CpaC
MGEFKERLAQILPGENIEVRTANDGIVLSGQVSSIARLERALELANRYAPERVSNLMVVGGTQQVMLQVRFSEMQRSVRKSFGSNFTINGSAGGVTTSAAATPSAGLGNNGFATFGFGAGAMNVSLTLEALETRGLVRTLAEPNLTALSGQEASFLAGGEYPVPVAQEDGVTTVSFKPFGVELNFIPTVVDSDIINLELEAAVSAIDSTSSYSDSNGLTVSGFSRRETSTTVELRDGESFAVAGLLQDDFNDLNDQVPWIGDVPILGALFRSAAYEREQTELVVIVTAHLVSPTRGAAVSLPTDRVQLPREADLFLLGKPSAGTQIPGAAGEVARQDFSGSYGYVMDE